MRAGGGNEEVADGMQARDAYLTGLGGLDVGPDGDVYLSLTIGWVLRVTPDGILHVLAELDRPEDVALAPDGSLYVTDGDQCVVRKIDTAGNIRTENAEYAE